MSILKKILLGAVAVFLLIGIIGYFILPGVIKNMATEKISKALHRPVGIEKISINPYALSIAIRGFKISETAPSNDSFLAFQELYVNLHGISSLWERKLILEEINLIRPYFSIKRLENGSYNFSDLMPQEEKPAAEENKPFYFSLHNIRISGGSIDFDDTPNKTRHTVRDMNLAVPVVSNIENMAKNYVEPNFSAKINGHNFELTGKTKPFLDSRETIFDLNIADLDIPFYLKYVPLKINFNLKSARLDTKLKLNFNMQQGKDPAVKISGDVALRKIILDDLKNNKILRLPELKISIAAAEPLNSRIHLSKLTVNELELAARRSKDGEINLLNLVASSQKEKKTPVKAMASADGAKPAKPLLLLIDELQLSAADLTFTDDVPAKKAVFRINPLQLKVSNFSTAKDARSSLDLALQLDKKSGEIGVKGQVGLEPLAAELDLDIKNLAIRPFQPYFTDKVKVNIQQGAVATTGKFSLAADEKYAPRFTYTGNLYVSRLAMIDESHANDFINWKQLYFEKLQAGYNPFFIDIKGISLTDFYARIIVNNDGTLNLQNIFGTGQKKPAAQQAADEKSTKEDEKKATGPDNGEQIKIGAVTFQGGTIDFSDRLIQPNFSVRMLNMAGSVKGLSTALNSRADVNLKGNIGYGAPIDVKGMINPLVKDLFAYVKVDFRDIELSPLTPYSSKYLGHPITKGKLTFAVEYLVEQKKLTAKNNILIDQLTLGDKVESPDAVKAPVGLAVSLLTNRNGQINLDIPLSGSLDDPDFSILPIIWQVIVNLITKALTSPFALLASLTGGGEELSFVEFDYGSSAVNTNNLKKIATLVKALQDRPQIKMDIEGYVDPENDKEGLRKAQFERKLKVQKLKDITAKGEAAMPVEQVLLNPDEYEKYLALAYNAEKFPKPRTAAGLQKTLPKEEMEKLMLTNITVTDSDLRQLAAQRVENVKELILKSGDIKPGRIFIVEAKALEPAQKDKTKMSRVDFKLK